MEKNKLLDLIKPDTFTDNCTHLYQSMYVVRTGAGFQHAVKDYAMRKGINISEYTYKQLISDNGIRLVGNYDHIVLPCILTFSEQYSGFHYTSFTTRTLK